MFGLLAALAMTGSSAIAQEGASETQPQQPLPWSSARPCENYSHPYEADLCQQWRMAQAAETAAEAAQRDASASERTARLAGLQTVIAATATALLFLMFLALLAAALAAGRATRFLSLARRHQEAEVRAYVDVDRLEFVETPEPDGVVKVRVVFKNSGQTPAFQISSAAQVGVREQESGDGVPFMPLPERAANPGMPRLGRDATSPYVVECEAIPNLADRVMQGKAVIVVWGWTEYLDIFDLKRRTAFQYLCNAETLKSGPIFKPMHGGNEAA
jgi:hypothetical protein